MTEPLKPCLKKEAKSILEALNNALNKADTVFDREMYGDAIDDCCYAFTAIEQDSFSASSPMRDEDVSGALNTLDRLYKRLPDVNATSYEENRALYEGLRNWISEQGLLRAKGE